MISGEFESRLAPHSIIHFSACLISEVNIIVHHGTLILMPKQELLLLVKDQLDQKRHVCMDS